MTDESWEEYQRRNIEWFGQGQERSWAATVEFWKHLVMVEATVLGLTVGLLATRVEGAPAPLVLAWLALLLGIFVGCVLIRGGIEAEQSRRRATFSMAHDIAEIRVRVEAGSLSVGSPEYQGLARAAVMQATPEWQRPSAFSPEDEEIAGPWFEKLPSAKFLKRNRVALYLWLEQHLARVELGFYALSIAAFVLMIATVLVPVDNGNDNPVRQVARQATRASPPAPATTPPVTKRAR